MPFSPTAAPRHEVSGLCKAKTTTNKHHCALRLRIVLQLFIRMTDAPTLSVTLLGAGQEVGRSCCVLQYRGKTIVCDAGVHPAFTGIASLPFIDDLDWSTVDAILITQ
jgi:predicted metal-dependent RNase